MITHKNLKKKKRSLKEQLKKLSVLINPAPMVGGLEISESVIRFIRIKGSDLKTVSLKIPPGIIVDGKVKDKHLLAAALKSVRSKIKDEKKPAHIVLTLPPSSVYSEVFSVPAVQKSKLKETAQLNLQMISPVDINQAYYGYELINESPTSSGELELLGAFIESSIADDFIEALKEASFIPVAIEFPSMSITRVISKENLLEPKDSYLLVNLTSDGVTIIVLKKGKLYFSHFTDWNTIQKEGEFNDFIVKEVKRVASFYTNKCQCEINDLVLITYNMDREISETFTKAFPKYKIRSLSVGEFSNLSPIWFATLGAAIRGNIPRFRDKSLSLTSLGVEEGYFQSLILNFVHMWRNIIFGTLIILIVIFFIGDVFLARFSLSLSRESALSQIQTSSEETDILIKQSQEFNNLLGVVEAADQMTLARSKFFREISSIANKNDTTLDRVSLSADGTVLIVGQSESENSVLDFKNSIGGDPDFSDVNLPLTEIKVRPDGTFLFTMTFKVLDISLSSQ